MRSGSPIEQPIQKDRVAEENISSCNNGGGVGEIAVVGIGPGSLGDMTPRALSAIREAELIVGYNAYIDLIDELVADKEIVGTGMMQEVERCSLAIRHAAAGKRVAVVSSGDPGIYAMAGLVLELLMKLPKAKRPKAKIIPGISAVSASAAILGAPLMHDFAVISLSDLMTPWELIKKRAELAAQGDFVVALYNPKSKKRTRHIEEIREIMLRHRSPGTPVGIVRGATRADESAVISTLDAFTKEKIDMFSLVVIGNSNTYVEDSFMITPRGYRL